MHMERGFKKTDGVNKQSLQWKPTKPGLDAWMHVGIKDSHMKEWLHKHRIWVGKDR